MRGGDGKLCLIVTESGKVWKHYVQRIIHEENHVNQNVEEDDVEGSIDCVGEEEVVKVLNEMKTEKAPRPSDVSLKLIAASEEVGIHLMVELCYKVPNRFAMPSKWEISIVFSIVKRKGDILKSTQYRNTKHLGQCMKVVVRVLKKDVVMTNITVLSSVMIPKVRVARLT